MGQLARISGDIVFYTQITMEAAEDDEFLRAMRSARIMGALVGVESITAEGLKNTYKSFNRNGRRPGCAAAAVPSVRHSCAGIVYFRVAQRLSRHFCRHGRACRPRRLNVCAIPAAHTFPGHSRFRKMGKADNGRQPMPAEDISARKALADSDTQQAETVRAAPEHVRRGDTPSHPAGMGLFLQHAENLASVAMRAEDSCPPGFSVHLEAISSDVCQYRHRRQQVQSHARGEVGPDHRKALSCAFCRTADPGPPGARGRMTRGVTASLPLLSL